jgi:hypothetical protein
MLLCAFAETFVGTYASTFTGYIHRLRGYLRRSAAAAQPPSRHQLRRLRTEHLFMTAARDQLAAAEARASERRLQQSLATTANAQAQASELKKVVAAMSEAREAAHAVAGTPPSQRGAAAKAAKGTNGKVKSSGGASPVTSADDSLVQTQAKLAISEEALKKARLEARVRLENSPRCALRQFDAFPPPFLTAFVSAPGVAHADDRPANRRRAGRCWPRSLHAGFRWQVRASAFRSRRPSL